MSIRRNGADKIEQDLLHQVEAEDWMADFGEEVSAPRRFTNDELWFLNRCKEMERELETERARTQFYRMQLKYEQRKWCAYKRDLVQKIKSQAGYIRKLEERLATDQVRQGGEAPPSPAGCAP